MSKFKKVISGYYRSGGWHIIKIDGAWRVGKGDLFPEHFTWESTLKGAKAYIQRMEAK